MNNNKHIPEHYYSQLISKSEFVISLNLSSIRSCEDINTAHEIFRNALFAAMEYSWELSKHHMYDSWQGFKNLTKEE